jgi:protein-L-isoaspartate O-methyltransferase
MIIPVGRMEQDLVLIEKNEQGVSRKSTIPVRFVPMTGRAQSIRKD